MKKVLLSFVMVFTVAFAMASSFEDIIVKNGGTVDFSKDTIYVEVCSGDELNVYVENNGGDEYSFNSSDVNAPAVYFFDNAATINCFNPIVAEEPTGYTYIVTDRLGRQVTVLMLGVMLPPATPQITTEAENFSVGNKYFFTATISDDGHDHWFDWSVTPQDGCIAHCSHCDEPETMVTISKSGTYILKCEVSFESTNTAYYGSCKSEATMEITVPEPTITYTYEAAPSYCEGRYSQLVFPIYGTNVSELTGTYVMEFISPTRESIVGYKRDDNERAFNILELSKAAPTTYYTSIKDGNGTVIANPVITIKPSPTVTCSSSTFYQDQEYVFINENYNSEDSYRWDIHGLGEYSIVNNREESITVKFLETGDYQVSCKNQSNGCSGYYDYLTVSTAPTPSIYYTYDATASNCLGQSAAYVIRAPNESTLPNYTGYVMEFISPAHESLQSTSFSVNAVYFDMNQFEEPGVYQTIIKDPDGVEIGRPVITIKDIPTKPSITYSSTKFFVNQEYEFVNENNSEISNHWYVSSVSGQGEYSFIGDRDESSVIIKFLNAGDYEVECYASSNGCGNAERINILVEESPVCSISGTPYSTLAEALSSIQEGETVVLNSDCSEEGAYANTSFSLDLNGHTATLQSLIVDESLTVTNGTLSASLRGHGSSSVLMVENATIECVPNPSDYMDGYKTFRWKGDIELANNGVLEVQDSAYFGGDEGFTLSIDNTSSMNLNNAIIAIPDMDADTATTLNQIRQYLPEGYTVNASEIYNWDADGYLLEFSPDANVVLQVQPDPIIFSVQNSVQYDETYNEYVLIGCAGVTNQLVITASEDVPTDVTYYISGGYGDHLIPAEVDGNTLTFNMYSSGSRTIHLAYSDPDNFLHNVPLEGIEDLRYVVMGVDTPEITEPTSSYVTGKDYDFQVESPNELLSYTWEVVDGDNNQTDYEGSSATISFATVGEYTIKCTATDPTIGCESGVNPVTVTVLEPVTYTIQPQLFCDSWWGATYDYIVTASRSLTESDVILVAGEKSFRGTPSGTQITFPLQYLEAGTYNITLLDADSTNILAESSVTIYGPSVQAPLDDDYDEYELNVPYTYTVTNPIEGHEYTWEIMYYGGDFNSEADPEDYVMETNAAKTTMTITFLHSADYRIEFMDETCGVGSDMAAYIPRSYTAESQTFYASDAEYQYSVVASEKFWGNYDEFILVVDDKSYHAFGKDGTFSIDFTLSGLEAGTYDNVVMFDADSANVLAGPTTISILPVVCNNTTRTFSYNENSNNYTYTLESVTTNADAGDVFTVVWEGTPDFSGQLGFALIDRSEEANWWRIVSDWTSVTVERGVPFSMSATLVVADSVSSASEIAFFSTIEGKVGQPTICETEFSFTQNCHNIALVGSLSVPLAYVDGSVAKNDVYYYNVKGHSDFAGEVMLSLVDQSEEAGWWDMLTDGQVVTVQKDADFEFEGYFVADKATSSTTPDVRFVINRTVDATVTDTTNLCISESSFSQYGADFACASEKIIFNGTNGKAVASLSEVAVGDVYECNIEGTADFTGEMYIALVDHSAEADWWLELAQSTAIQVVEGEPFEYKGTFTVETQTASTTPEFALMIGHGDAETGSISQVCVTNASIRKPTVYTVSDITLCEYQTIASVTVTAEPAAIFEVVSETGDVIQSFSGETSYANFNISDLTVGAYKYYIKENGAAKDSFNITVYANPTVTITTSPESICVGDEVSFIANATGNDLTYQWENSSLEIADATSETAKWQSTVAGQYPISCTVTGEGGCTASAELVFLVNPIPVVEIEGSSEVAAGEEVSYTAAVTYEGEPNYAYSWSGAAQGSDQTLTTIFTDEGVSNLYCEVTTREGCKNADTLEVTVNPAEAPFVCDNNEITLAYSGETSTSGMYGYTYLYENVITTAAEGDSFVMEWNGTPNFSGDINVAIIDRSEEAGYWSEISNWETISVEKGVPFSVIKTFTINGTPSSEPEFGLAATVVLEKQTEGVKLCQTDFSFAKEEFVKVFEMYYNEYGENWQRRYSETQTEVLQAVYEATGESEYVPVMEDVFMLSITGKANYTGSLDFYIVDERQEVEYWQQLTEPYEMQVKEGEYFSIQVPLTITKTLYDNIRLNRAGLQVAAFPIDVLSNLETTDLATISLTEYSFTFIPSGGQLEVLKTITLNYDEYASDEDGDGISDSWRRDGGTNISEFGTLITEKTGLYSYFFGTLSDHEYYTPKVGDKLTYSMKGTADFTGRISCALIDESAEVCYYAEFSSYNETYVNEGEPFKFEGELVITNVETICEDNPARMMNPEFHISIFPSVSSTDAAFDNTKEYTLSLTDYTLDFIVDDYECDGTRLMFGSAESLNSLQKSIADEITEETTFNLSWTGTPNFTGVVQAVVIDASEEFSGMVLSQSIVEIEVEANKAFTVNQDVVVSASKSSKPNYVIEIFVPYQTEGFEATAPTVDICETAFSFVKVEQQPLSVSFSQDTYEMTAGGSATLCLVADGFDLSEANISYTVSEYLAKSTTEKEGCVVVTDVKGKASTQLVEAEVLYKGTAYYATADIQIIEEQPNCEGNLVTFSHAEENYGSTTLHIYEMTHEVEIIDASDDDMFEFEWSYTPNFSANSVSVALVDLSNNNKDSYTVYFSEGDAQTQTITFSLPFENNVKSTYAIVATVQSYSTIDNATLCESYFSFKKVEKPQYVKVFATEYNYYGTDTDGDGNSDGWQGGFDEFPTAVYEATGNTGWSPAIGDVFSLSMQGVANFTGTVNFFMVDQREAAGYWGIASEHVPGFYVAEGEPFNITDYFAVTSTGNDDVTYAPNFVVLCQPEVTSTSAGFSEFITYKLSLTNYGLSFYPSTATGTCDGNLITTLNSGVVDITNYVDNAIETGDKVTVNWSATPDFTGELSVALVDGRNTAEDAWLFMADPITFDVTKDVAFEVSMPFDVTDTHVNPFYQMYIAVNDREGSADVYNICSSEFTVTINKEDIPLECDGNLIKITKQYADNYRVDGVPTVGDVYDVELTITPNFSGELWLNLTDKSFMNSISEQQKINLLEGVTTKTTVSFEIIANSSADYSEGFELTKLIRPNNTEGTYYLCESNFSIKKHEELPNYVKVIEVPYDEWGIDYDGDDVSDNWREGISAYESLGVDTYAPILGDHVEYSMKGIADFTGTISLGLIDEREEACYYAEFSDYNSYDVVEGEEFEISGTLVVSNIQSVCGDKAVELMNPMLNVACLPDVKSTSANFSTEKIYSLSFTDYSLVYEQKQSSDCMLEITMENSDSKALAHVYEEVSVGDEYYAHVTGVADFTGEVFFAFIDNSEEANWWYMLDNETKGLSVVEGDTLNFEGYFTVSNPVLTSKPDIAFMVGLVDSEGLGKVANICVSSVEFVKQENTFTCEGDKLILNGAEGGALATFDEVSLGDVYTCHVEGVADFTDEVYIALVDHSKDAGWWFEMAEPLAFDVVAGEPFVYEGTFTVTEQTKSTAPEYVIYIGHSKAENGPISRFCITKSQIEKQPTVFTVSDVTICEGEIAEVDVTASKPTNFQVFAENGNSVASVEDGSYIQWRCFDAIAHSPFLPSGIYTYTIKENGEEMTSFTVTVNPKPSLRIHEESDTLIVGTEFNCTPSVTNAEPADVTYLWTGGKLPEEIVDYIPMEGSEFEESTQNLTKTFAEVGKYLVACKVENQYGCNAFDTVIVSVFDAKDFELSFDQRSYELTEDESITACLTIGEVLSKPQFEFNSNVISLTEPSDKQSTCGTITGLMAGQTSVIVSAYANGTTYTDTAIVVVKMKANKETLISLIDEGRGIQEKVLEGTYVISPIVYNEFQETMQNANEIRDNNKATQDEVDAVANSLYVAIDAIKLIAAHQMPDPVLTTEEITVCHNRTGDAISLAEFAQTTTVNGKLQWFDESGNILESTPEIDFKTIGKLTYYVTQIGTGATAECLPSDTLPMTINIVYVAAPEMNVYEQKLCNGEELQPFVAKTTNNVVWFNADSVKVAEGNSFTPSATGTYYAYANESVDGCVSEATIVTYMLGRKVTPTVVMKDSKTEFAVGEPIEMAVQNIDADVFSIVWTVDGTTIQGEEFSIATLEEGSHTIVCREIDMVSGCYDSTMVEIEVKNDNVPVTSILVSPDVMELYTNERGHLGVSFAPSYATNQRYVVTVSDTSVAVVSGATVIPVGAGSTTVTVMSAENADIRSEVSVKVTEYVAARELSLPRIITMGVGETIAVNASVIPSNASKNKVYFMEKSDKSVVEITREGVLTANGEGTAVINAYTEGGLQATSVVYVTSNSEEITSVEVPTKVELKLGDSISVPVKVTPTSLLVKDLAWTIGDEEIVSFNNGVVKALKKGETTLTVSYKSISETIAVVVNSSSAPVVAEIPPVTMNQDGSATVDLSLYVTDEGGFEGLDITPVSDGFEVFVVDGMVTITPKDGGYTGTDTLTLTITNGEGLSTDVEVPVTVKESGNEAPVVKIHEILFKEGDQNKIIDLSDVAEDDMTEWSSLKFTFSVPRNGVNNQQTIVAKVMKKTQLRVVKMLEFEQDTIFVSVSDGTNTTEDTIVVYVGTIPNKAPVISSIPVQNETDEEKFGAIDLTRYVTDDYTTPSAIAWTTSASENIAVTVSNGTATVRVLNEFWRGAEPVTFTAKDEEGAESTATVYYVRNVTVKTEPQQQTEPGEEIVANWEGAPSFDIMSMRTIGVPGDSYVLMASLFGFNGSFEWSVEGSEGLSAGSLMQTVTFAEPGEYDVTLTVMSADGNYQKSITKEKMLTVVGIDNRSPEICKGQSIVLTATEGMDSYYWTSGDAKESAMVRPGETTTVAVTMKQGLFTFVDSVRVKVSVPVSLMEDSVMCRGTKFDLEAQGEFVSYTWSTGATTKSIEIPDVVEAYSVMTVDDMQCVSADTFNLTKVNDLPPIDLGGDLTPCDGTTVTLDAGAGFDYLWKGGSTERTVSLTAGTDTVWARITDGNLCVNYDTVVVAFTYPYPEQIGVATFSETTDHIILAWEKTAGVNTVSYRIERETNVTDNWEQVGDDVMFAEAGLVVDEDVNYKQRAYKYRLVTTDGCGNEAVSEVHRSMISTTTRNDDGTKTLQWCAYEPMSNVTQYLVLRGYDATAMDTVDQVPASNLYEIWNETDSRFVDDRDIKYRVVFRLKGEVDENAVNTLDGQPVEGYYTKAESGPFSLALSNIAEAENNDAVEDVAFPADVVVYPTKFSSYLNVAIAAYTEMNFTVEVLNANGQIMVRTQTGDITKTLLQLPTDSFKQGVYTVRISDGQQTKTLKVVK